jgi:hypothetical protein
MQVQLFPQGAGFLRARGGYVRRSAGSPCAARPRGLLARDGLRGTLLAGSLGSVQRPGGGRDQTPHIAHRVRHRRDPRLAVTRMHPIRPRAGPRAGSIPPPPARAHMNAAATVSLLARLGRARACKRGAIAQLGERLDRTQEVAGSSPASSISKKVLLRRSSRGQAGTPASRLASAARPASRHGRRRRRASVPASSRPTPAPEPDATQTLDQVAKLGDRDREDRMDPGGSTRASDRRDRWVAGVRPWQTATDT